jgi:hypothetical protein
LEKVERATLAENVAENVDTSSPSFICFSQLNLRGKLWSKRSNAQNVGVLRSSNMSSWETWRKKRSTGVWNAAKSLAWKICSWYPSKDNYRTIFNSLKRISENYDKLKEIHGLLEVGAVCPN